MVLRGNSNGNSEAESGLCTSTPNYFLETEFWVKEKRIALLFCQAKGATAGECPQDCVSQLGGGSEEFYSNGSKRA